MLNFSTMFSLKHWMYINAHAHYIMFAKETCIAAFFTHGLYKHFLKVVKLGVHKHNTLCFLLFFSKAQEL